MTGATQEPNGAAPYGMTAPTAPAQGSEADKSNASRRSPAVKDKAAASDGSTKTRKKRRKVNHACIYCRRSHMTCDLERPCTRCIKRNIGHLCHDEPRESVKKSKVDAESANGENDTSKREVIPSEPSVNTLVVKATDAGLNLAPPPLPHNRGASTAAMAQPVPVPAPQVAPLSSNNPSFLNYNDWNSSSQNHPPDMHHFHPSYMFNTSEISSEFNLLNDFLSNSLMDDGSHYANGDFHHLFSDPSLTYPTGSLTGNSVFHPSASGSSQLLPPPAQTAAGSSISRPSSSFPPDKATEKYFQTAADPAGLATPEERIHKLLEAKMNAGLLKPFNYIKGYARLNQYMEQNMQSTSRQRILHCINKFRPIFREKIQRLTDVELVKVEMGFEQMLMKFDRIFATMAIPACCWRRTGEIFRGNKEMAELIHVPFEDLRDGKIAIHEIMSEPSLVGYWEKFGQIAFDCTKKGILSSCALKAPDVNSTDPEIRCCFSFTVKRDRYNIPLLIIGNFLPLEDAPAASA